MGAITVPETISVGCHIKQLAFEDLRTNGSGQFGNIELGSQRVVREDLGLLVGPNCFKLAQAAKPVIGKSDRGRRTYGFAS